MWTTPSGNQRLPANTYIKNIAQRPDDYRVIERMPLDNESVPVKFDGTGKPVRSIAILDTETTGIKDADVIELGIIRCGVDEFNHLCSIDEIYDEFNDPGCDIPSEITKLTGITDTMVKGKRLNEAKVNHILRDDPVIVVHNAAYDRPLFEKLFPDDNHKWVCSMEYYDWYNRGFGTKKLELLLEREGFFFDAHRAYMDCFAVAYMLHLVPESLDEILKPRTKISAWGCPYGKKDRLKDRGYKWDGTVWSTILPDNLDEEMEFLKELYTDGDKAKRQNVDPRVMFKKAG